MSENVQPATCTISKFFSFRNSLNVSKRRLCKKVLTACKEISVYGILDIFIIIIIIFFFVPGI